MNILTNEKLRVGEYLSLSFNNENIEFFKEGKRISSIKISDTDTQNIETLRKRKLKSVVTKVYEGSVDVELVRFADLHRHSGYSLLDGASKIEDLAERTEYVGALTDHGNMHGFVEYYKVMKKKGKQPILGFEAYSETMEGKKNSNHLLLLAKNEAGYKNLIKLTSESYHNFYRKPHVSYEMLENHNEGLIVLSACLGGEIPQKILDGNYEGAKKVAEHFRTLFKDDFYLEIQRHNIGRDEDIINDGLLKLSKELNIKLVATTDSHYSNKEDEKIHEILLCLQTGKTMLDHDRMKFQGDGYHIHTSLEMEEKFKDMLYVLDNTLEIAEKCSDFKLDLGSLYLPEFTVPEGYTTNSYFEKIVWDGFEERFQGKDELNDEGYIERVKFEIEVIERMGYAAYFLIVHDFIDYARRNDIAVGPGRGSAVGSLVAYTLKITDLDPIPYDLFFERFLNPERVSMPDVDIDFCYERRDEVIDYVKNKYGEEAVSRIVTFGTLGARVVVRDVTRVMNYPYNLGDRIAKAIPITVGTTLTSALEDNPELKKMYQNEEDVKTIIDTALKLEGLPRHASVHACGVIIAKSDVDDYIPELLMGDKVKERTSQVTMTEVEDLGLLKMDFLGLRTMTVIDGTIKSLNLNTNDNVSYDDIPHDDPYIYQDIAKGKTYGVFQLESPGMRKFMMDLYSDVELRIKRIERKYDLKGYLNPIGSGDKDEFSKEMKILGQELFERLIAGISLYRPGPMDYIPDYINGMNNPDEIIYDTPELEPILKATYGQIVYQEQVMQIVQKLAGYSLGRADLVRRAMGKKIASIMEAEKEIFIEGRLNDDGSIDVPGCIRNGISKEAAEAVWHKMEDFCKYAFNKSHSAGYAVIATKTAWLKLYYPVDFMASTLNSFIDKQDKLKSYISVCKDMKIEILPPDINKSGELFRRSDRDIIFGLKGIRNLGKTSALIIDEREIRKEFEDYQDMVTRLAKYQKVNKKSIEGLVYAGALDSFGKSRNAKIEIVEAMLKVANKEKDGYSRGQVSVFDLCPDQSHLLKIEIPELDEFQKRYKLEKEKEFAGFYVTEHPMDEHEKVLAQEDIDTIGFYTHDEEDEEDGVSFDKLKVKMAGIIKDIQIFYTKRDQKPLYVFKIEDRSGEMDCVMFSDKIELNLDKIVDGNIVLIDGTLKDDDRGVQLIVNTMTSVESLSEAKRKEVVVINEMEKERLDIFRRDLANKKNYKGNVPIYLVLNGNKYKFNETINLNSNMRSWLKSWGSKVKIVDLE